MSRLNIYRLSGLSDEPSQKPNYRFWTADTDTLTNSRAANYALSQVNALMAVIKYGEPTNETYNELNLFSVILEALALAKRDTYVMRKCGYVIQSMLNDGYFDYTITADNSADTLQECYNVFDRYYSENKETQSGAFVEWYEVNIIGNNYNEAPQEAPSRLRRAERQSVGSLDPSDYKDLATYVADNGSYFLYMFIGESKIGSYSSTIKKRYRKEIEMYEAICKQCSGVYSKETVYNMLYAGCCDTYGMTPDQKIAQLKKMGGIGDLIVVLTAISLALSILATLWAICKEVFQFIVKIPDDEDLGVPTPDDWNIKDYKNKKTNTSSLPVVLIGLGALILIFNKK